MKNIYIYKLIDPFTQDVRYIGKTTNIKRRLNAHVNRCNTNKFHSAAWIKKIIKKGKKPIIEIIETCDENNWEEREIYWISFYKAKFDLTNILPGGGKNATYGMLGKTWTEQHKTNNRKARLGKKVAHSEEGNKNRAAGVRRYYNSKKKPVYQYSLNGEFLKKWDCAVDAQKELGVKNITRVCGKDKHKVSGGYMWSYNFESMSEYKKRKHCTKKILQLSINDEIIKEYTSVGEAATTLNIARSAISNCLTGLTKTTAGFKWQYSNNKGDKT